MRLLSTSNGTLIYPNSTAFIFSPTIVELTTPGKQEEFSLQVVFINNNGVSFTETRQAYKGRAQIDVSRIMQMLFQDEMNIDEKFIEPGLKAGTETSTEMEYSIYKIPKSGAAILLTKTTFVAVYGALDREAFSLTGLRFRWNNGQVFTIPIWSYDSTSVSIFIKAGNTSSTVTIEAQDNVGYVNIDPRQICVDKGFTNLVDAIDSGLDITIRSTKSAPVVTEAGTETIGDLNYTIRTLCTPKGARTEYIMWLDRHGQIRYYNFDAVSKESVQISESESFRRSYLMNPSLIDAGNRVSLNPDKSTYSEERTMELVAKNVDKDTFNDLTSLASSPFVFLQREAHWERVRVAAASYTWDCRPGKTLQDFPIQIIRQARNTIGL